MQQQQQQQKPEFLVRERHSQTKPKEQKTDLVERIAERQPWFCEFHVRCWLDCLVTLQEEMSLTPQVLLRGQCMFLQLLLHPNIELDESALELALVICTWQQYKTLDYLEDPDTTNDLNWTRKPGLASIRRFLDNEFTVDQIKQTEWDIFRLFDFDVYRSIQSLYEHCSNSFDDDSCLQWITPLNKYVQKHLLANDADELSWLERLYTSTRSSALVSLFTTTKTQPDEEKEDADAPDDSEAAAAAAVEDDDDAKTSGEQITRKRRWQDVLLADALAAAAAAASAVITVSLFEEQQQQERPTKIMRLESQIAVF